jgi:hypothetical protein
MQHGSRIESGMTLIRYQLDSCMRLPGKGWRPKRLATQAAAGAPASSPRCSRQARQAQKVAMALAAAQAQ